MAAGRCCPLPGRWTDGSKRTKNNLMDESLSNLQLKIINFAQLLKASETSTFCFSTIFLIDMSGLSAPAPLWNWALNVCSVKASLQKTHWSPPCHRVVISPPSSAVWTTLHLFLLSSTLNPAYFFFVRGCVTAAWITLDINICKSLSYEVTFQKPLSQLQHGKNLNVALKDR